MNVKKKAFIKIMVTGVTGFVRKELKVELKRSLNISH
jgi:hypothetical protein